MPYTPGTWADDDPSKPLSAARMTNIETGISTAQNDQTGDVTLASDTDVNGAGDIILKTGGVERGRITATGTGSGFLGASLPARFNTTLRPQVTNFSQQLAGIDTTNGQMLWISSTAGQQLYTSADLGVSFSADRTLPAGNWYEKKKIVAFKGKLYLICLESGTALSAIYQTTPNYTAGTTWTWTKVYSGRTGNNDNIPTNLSTDGTALYFGEYGDPSGGPQLWRSTDGTTWTSVQTAANNRHHHAVEPDPYNPGHVWATWGDSNASSIYVSRSTDYGVTWTTLVNTAGYGSWVQAVQISFSSKYVWFTCDDVSGPAAYTMDRTELIPRAATVNRHTDLPVPNPIARQAGTVYADGVFTSGSKTMTSATAAFSASDVGRGVFSANVIGADVFIETVTNSTTVQLNVGAAKTGTATFYLGGSRWSPNNAYFGIVDPATDIFYIASWSPTIMDDPTRGAFFYIPTYGYRVEMYQSLPPVNGLQRWGSFIYGGYFWAGRWRVPLLSR